MEKLSLSFVISGTLSSSVTAVFGKLSSSVDNVSQKLARLNSIANRISAYRETKRELWELALKMRRGGEEAEEAAQKWRESAEKLRKLRAELDRAGISVKRLAEYERSLSAQTERLNRQMDHLNRAARFAAMRESAFSGWQTLLGTGLALAGPIKAAMDFESAMAEVRKVVSFAGEKDVRVFRKEINELARRIPLAQTELLALAASGGRLGVARKDLKNFVTLSAQMAVAFDMLPEEAGEAMAKLSNVFGIPLSRMRTLGDAVNQLGDNMAARERDIVKIMLRAGATGKQFGLSAKGVAALGAAFLALGRPPEVAATGINAMLTKLMTADKQGRRFQEALAELGFSAQDLKEMIQKDAQGALLAFLSAVKRVPKEARAGILTDLFGMEYSDDLALLVEGLDTYRKALGLVADESKYAGSMQRTFKQRASTTAARLQILKNRLYTLAVNIGSVVLPGLNAFFGAFGKVTDVVTAFTERFPRLTTVVVGALAGLTGAVLAFKAASIGTKFVLGGLGELFYRFRAGIEGARVALLAFRGAELAGELSGWRLAVFRTATAVKAYTLSLWGGVRALGAFSAAQLRTGLSALPGLFARATAAARAFNLALVASPWGLAIAGAAAAVYLIARHWDWVKGKLVAGWEKIKAGAVQAWETFKRFAGVATYFMPVIGPLKLIHALAEKLFHIDLTVAGRRLVSSLAKGILSAAAEPVRAIKSVAERVRRFLPFSPAKEGPLAALDRSGPGLVKTFAEGLSPARAVDAAERLSQAVSAKLRLPAVPDLVGRVRYALEGESFPVFEHLERIIRVLSGAEPKGLSAKTAPVTITVNFSPRITVGGDAPSAVREAVSRTLAEERDRLRRMLEEILWEERRLSYA